MIGKSEVNFSVLQGLTMEKFVPCREDIRIRASGREFLMQHDQDCCEEVGVESVTGCVARAVGEVITDAVVHTNKDEPGRADEHGYIAESHTWTYYTIRTQSETIVIRWYGSSNGYYSEEVSFYEEKE